MNKRNFDIATILTLMTGHVFVRGWERNLSELLFYIDGNHKPLKVSNDKEQSVKFDTRADYDRFMAARAFVKETLPWTANVHPILGFAFLTKDLKREEAHKFICRYANEDRSIGQMPEHNRASAHLPHITGTFVEKYGLKSKGVRSHRE